MEYPRSPGGTDRRVARPGIERLRSFARGISTGLTAQGQLRTGFAAVILLLGASLALVTQSPGAPPAAVSAPANPAPPSPVQTVDTPEAGDVAGAAMGAKAAPAPGQELSRAQAIDLVQVRYHARVVRSSETQDRLGRHLYILRLLSGGGKVWTVRIDAHTGVEVP